MGPPGTLSIPALRPHQCPIVHSHTSVFLRFYLPSDLGIQMPDFFRLPGRTLPDEVVSLELSRSGHHESVQLSQPPNVNSQQSPSHFTAPRQGFQPTRVHSQDRSPAQATGFT
ncbi:hypothetical protein NDU88_002179 [Pleurodeles waltl]|uniref:Uncharacterized protein n=1 Tax=Pleurodeles waltl TaxID=8319 RepID=A0AAV7U9R4_PLEWA|nr:hypothetical protein NDU88_002179 [Pleurodeles waltl]